MSLVAVTIVRHLIENRIDWRQQRRAIMAQTGTLTAIALLTGTALWMRGEESLQALIYGLSPVGVTQAEYVVSGAGMGKPGEVRLRFNTELWEAIGQFGQWR